MFKKFVSSWKLISLLFLVGCVKHIPQPKTLASIKPSACITTSAPTYSGSLQQTNAQLTVIPLPTVTAPLGGLTGAGLNYTLPAYGNTIYRCTDVNTDPKNTLHYSYEISDSGNANEAIWNANGTMLRMMEAGTGTSRIFGFSNGVCVGPNIFSQAPAGATFSRVNPNVDYSLTGTVVSQRTFDYTQPLLAPAIQTLFDFKTCPGLAAMGKITWSGQLTEINDTEFLSSFSDLGAQNTGEYVAVYNIGGQCQTWNTLTGVMTNPAGSPTAFYPFTIHDAVLYPGGWAAVDVGTCPTCPVKHGPFLWQTGTTTVNTYSIDVGGHATGGYSTFINIINDPAMVARQFSNPSTPTQISWATNAKFPNPQDGHQSWQNVDLLDSYPFFSSQANINLPQPVQITVPLENEIWGIVPATGTFIRVAPTLSSGIANTFNFRSQYAIIGVDPTGKCIAWGSDGEGKFGNTDGVTSTCTLGAAKPNECRSDVLIVCPN